MSHKYAISVIMPAYCSGKYIAAAIDSILEQTFHDYEFIIIDDHSEDETWEIICEYAKKNTHIHALRNEKNEGVARTLNKALSLCHGKYIARMDADDISLPHRLARQYEFLEGNPAVFLVGTGVFRINEQTDVTGIYYGIVGENEIAKKLPKENCIYHPTVMFRNENIRYREKMHFVEDYDLWLCLVSDMKRINNIKEPLLYFRMSHTSISRKNAGQQALFANMARVFYQQRVLKNSDDYSNFDPDEILLIKESSNDPIFLSGEMAASLKLGDFSRVSELAKRYICTHGFSIRVLKFLCAAFLKINLKNPFVSIPRTNTIDKLHTR
jgi:glycosyltransferase involved in cell wall biosynthesis